MSLPPRQSNAQPELLECLMGQYRQELIAVSYTMQDFVGDFTMEHLKDLAPQERIEGLSTEQLLADLSPEA